MKDALKVYFLKTISSEMIYKRAIKELRELDFKAFKLIVLRQLCKELKIKPSLFEREYITIRYKTEDRIIIKHKHYLEQKDFHEFGGCYGFWCNPPIASSIKVERTIVRVQTLQLNIRPYMHQICHFLKKKKNACTENIFLDDGSEENQNELRKKMRQSTSIDFENDGFSVHDVANILKEYFNEMSEPLFPLRYYSAYKRISRLEKSYKELESERLRNQMSWRGRLPPPDSAFKSLEKKILDCIQLIVHLMPFWKRQLLYNLIDTLNVICSYRDYNHMNATILGLIFAPILICPRSLPDKIKSGASKDMSHLIGRMINLGRDIFDAPYNLQIDAWQYARTKGSNLGLSGALISTKRV